MKYQPIYQRQNGKQILINYLEMSRRARRQSTASRPAISQVHFLQTPSRAAEWIDHMTKPIFVIEKEFRLMQAKIEKQLQERDALNAIVEAALIHSCDFAWAQSHPYGRIDREKAKIVFSIVSIKNMQVREDGKVQCWGTKETYLSAKTLCDELNKSNKRGDYDMKVVVAQYVGKDVIVAN